MSEKHNHFGDSTPALAIKINNTASNDPCALCGARTDPECGPELFLAESWALVCYPCGERHAPELVRCLEGYRQGLSLDEYLGDSPGGVGRVSEDEDPF